MRRLSRLMSVHSWRVLNEHLLDGLLRGQISRRCAWPSAAEFKRFSLLFLKVCSDNTMHIPPFVLVTVQPSVCAQASGWFSRRPKNRAPNGNQRTEGKEGRKCTVEL